jgi:hypothetical protein
MNELLAEITEENVDLPLSLLSQILKLTTSKEACPEIIAYFTVFVPEGYYPDLNSMAELLNKCLYPLALVKEIHKCQMLGSGIANDVTPEGMSVVDAFSVTVLLKV